MSMQVDENRSTENVEEKESLSHWGAQLRTYIHDKRRHEEISVDSPNIGR